MYIYVKPNQLTRQRGTCRLCSNGHGRPLSDVCAVISLLIRFGCQSRRHVGAVAQPRRDGMTDDFVCRSRAMHKYYSLFY
ncbi:hypothetical protein J6590_001301 [Homalodisca vitripennis]|nr:hypothetical protein J6590_001301 [Homalodisca vitripennis]